VKEEGIAYAVCIAYGWEDYIEDRLEIGYVGGNNGIIEGWVESWVMLSHPLEHKICLTKSARETKYTLSDVDYRNNSLLNSFVPSPLLYSFIFN